MHQDDNDCGGCGVCADLTRWNTALPDGFWLWLVDWFTLWSSVHMTIRIKDSFMSRHNSYKFWIIFVQIANVFVQIAIQNSDSPDPHGLPNW